MIKRFRIVGSFALLRAAWVGTQDCFSVLVRYGSNERDKPAGFRYLVEDRRNAELDRRAIERGNERRAIYWPAPTILRLIAKQDDREQELTADNLRKAGMHVH